MLPAVRHPVQAVRGNRHDFLIVKRRLDRLPHLQVVNTFGPNRFSKRRTDRRALRKAVFNRL